MMMQVLTGKMRVKALEAKQSNFSLLHRVSRVALFPYGSLHGDEKYGSAICVCAFCHSSDAKGTRLSQIR